MPVLAVTAVLAAVHSALLPLTPVPADIAVAVAAYSVAVSLPRLRSASVVIAVVMIVAAVNPLAFSGPAGATSIVFWPVKSTEWIVPLLVLGTAWIAGDSTRTRRAYLAEVEQRALDAERDRDRRAELAVAAERERVTGELHDVIAHALSVMVVQAQGAGAALRRQRLGQADEALDAIVATGRGALAETRRVLGAIRVPVTPSGLPGFSGLPGDLELAPQPRLDDLPALAESVRKAGTPVELRVVGPARPLPPGIELSAYRIVQEALTNAMRHAGPGAAVDVQVGYGDGDLVLDISDNGHLQRPRGSRRAEQPLAGRGHGIAGMRARVAMLGGDLSAGPGPAGGFRVRAQLPLPAPVPAASERSGP